MQRTIPIPLAKPSAMLVAVLHPDNVLAHSFGPAYSPPVPIWLYLYGALAALVVSFVLVGYFVTAKAQVLKQREFDLGQLWKPGRCTRGWLMGVLRGLSVATLALTIVTGFLGTDNAYRNLNMTLFWVVFCLGFTYLTALVGDWYAALNPFRVIANSIGRIWPRLTQGRFPYPKGLEYWPALAIYVAFIGFELFGSPSPLGLSVALTAYGALNLLGCWLVGRTTWFAHCEFFGVFLSQVARIAPLRCQSDANGTITGLHLRAPFADMVQRQPIPLSLLVFVLFMISSTAFDGLHETALWVGSLWTHLYQWVLTPLYGTPPPLGFSTVQKLLLVLQGAALILSPFAYFAAYALFLFMAWGLTGRKIKFRTLLLSFGICLIPIAITYHFAHYYAFLQAQGPQLVRLISDPMGFGWDLFGTARIRINATSEPAVVWHIQVLMIVVGHVASVYLAHRQALAIFPSRRDALVSQLPTLMLMMGITYFGLRILSLPMQSGIVLH